MKEERLTEAQARLAGRDAQLQRMAAQLKTELFGIDSAASPS